MLTQGTSNSLDSPTDKLPGYEREDRYNTEDLGQEPRFIRNNRPVSTLNLPPGSGNTAASRSELLPTRQDQALVMGKYTVYFINPKENGKLYSLIIEWPHIEKVREAIRDVIPYINAELAKNNSNYALAQDPNLFEFYKAKKNGKPNYDYPSLDITESISTTGIQRLTLVEKTPVAIIERLELKRTMVENPMPSEPKNGSFAGESREEYIIETTCCCIKTKRKIVKSYPKGSGTNNLRQGLLH